MIVGIREKVEAAKQFLSGKRRAAELAELFGVDRNTIYRWSKKYRKYGWSGLEVQTGIRYASKNAVYSTELKMAAVKDYLSGKDSQVDVCQKYKIRSKTTLQNWIKIYNAHGDLNSAKYSGGGSYMKQGRETTQEERICIVKDCMSSGKNYGEIAQKYAVSYQQVRAWTLRFEKLGESGLEDRRGRRKKDQVPRTAMENVQIENEQLKHQIYLLMMERDLLKKLQEIERSDALDK